MRVGDDERLVDQADDEVEDVGGVDGPAGADVLDPLEGEPAGEHGEAAQEHLLRRGQQPVAPVQRRP